MRLVELVGLPVGLVEQFVVLVELVELHLNKVKEYSTNYMFLLTTIVIVLVGTLGK